MLVVNSLGAVSDILAVCLILLVAGVIALTSRLNSDWLDDVGVATQEPAPPAKGQQKVFNIKHNLYTFSGEEAGRDIVQLGCYQHRYEWEGLLCFSTVWLLSCKTDKNDYHAPCPYQANPELSYTCSE